MPFVIEWVEKCGDDQQTQLIKTPAGDLSVESCGDVICRTEWANGDQFEVGTKKNLIAEKLDGYCQDPGREIPIKLLHQGSPFCHRVWEQLCRIPFGTVLTYKALATSINTAPRAVGGACRANCFPFIIPCHRVVSVSGPGGYAGQRHGDAITVKLKLLGFESEFGK